MSFFRRLFCSDISKELNDVKLYLSNIKTELHLRNLEVARQQKEIINLKTQIPTPQLDIKKPDFLVDGYIYKPVITSEIDNFHVDANLMYPLEGLYKYRFIWETKSHDQKLVDIWRFVIKQVTYVFDKVESWQFPVETLARARGDCEDSTILFVALARAAGIPEDSVFNACGWWNMNDQKIGHSWPIAKMEDGKWYIFESTLDVEPKPTIPKLFKGSPYKAEWGLANWVFSGAIKDGQPIGYQI